MGAPKPAIWTAGSLKVVMDKVTGELTASAPLLESKVLAATVNISITADRALRIDVVNEPGSAGLSGFQAWSNT